jgi:hypothetical protein
MKGTTSIRTILGSTYGIRLVVHSLLGGDKNIFGFSMTSTDSEWQNSSAKGIQFSLPSRTVSWVYFLGICVASFIIIFVRILVSLSFKEEQPYQVVTKPFYSDIKQSKKKFSQEYLASTG